MSQSYQSFRSVNLRPLGAYINLKIRLNNDEELRAFAFSKRDCTQYVLERFKPDAWLCRSTCLSRRPLARAYLHPFLKWAGVTRTRSLRPSLRHWLLLKQERARAAVLWAARTYKGSSSVPASSRSAHSLPLSTEGIVRWRVGEWSQLLRRTPRVCWRTRLSLARAELTCKHAPILHERRDFRLCEW